MSGKQSPRFSYARFVPVDRKPAYQKPSVVIPVKEDESVNENKANRDTIHLMLVVGIGVIIAIMVDVLVRLTIDNRAKSGAIRETITIDGKRYIAI